jgi:hypothetical protein
MLGWLGCWPGTRIYRLRTRAWASGGSDLGLLTIQAKRAAGGRSLCDPIRKGVADRELSGLPPG